MDYSKMYIARNHPNSDLPKTARPDRGALNRYSDIDTLKGFKRSAFQDKNLPPIDTPRYCPSAIPLEIAYLCKEAGNYI